MTVKTELSTHTGDVSPKCSGHGLAAAGSALPGARLDLVSLCINGISRGAGSVRFEDKPRPYPGVRDVSVNLVTDTGNVAVDGTVIDPPARQHALERVGPGFRE